MRRTTRFVVLAAAMAALAGCQQVAWKPGAGAADLDRDTAACEAQYSDETAVHDCLRKRGWVLRLPKQADAAIEEEVVAPSVATAPSASGAPAAGATAMATSTADEPRSTAPAAPRIKAVPKPVDPNKPVSIQAWWKMGGQADALNEDIDACVATLGPSHKPDLQQKLYTRALVDCLKGKGWYGR